MIKPKNISIIKDGDIFRLRYTNNKLRITTRGFKTRKELSKIIREDEFFELKT